MIDQYGRIIDYLRISVTDLCNLRCQYCIPRDGVKKLKHEDILSLEEIEQIAKICVELGITKIRITGGEPLLRKGILYLIEKIGALNEIRELAITTNGLLLKTYAKDLKKFGVNTINISLDTLDEERYFRLTKGVRLPDVLAGLEEAKRMGWRIKLNVVLIKGINEDEIESFVNLTKNEDIDVRFIELMPLGEQGQWANERYIPASFVLEKVPSLKKKSSQNISSAAVYYGLSNAKGRIGLIRPISEKFCKFCNRLRLSADGRLQACLHGNKSLDIKTKLRQEEDIKNIIEKYIFNKPAEHKLEIGEYMKRNMIRIGG